MLFMQKKKHQNLITLSFIVMLELLFF